MMFQILALAVCAVSAFPQGRGVVPDAVEAEAKTTTTPVPIIKQINKVNDDGSYTFGYEAGDGSFRIEKKELSGHVKGIILKYDSPIINNLHIFPFSGENRFIVIMCFRPSFLFDGGGCHI